MGKLKMKMGGGEEEESRLGEKRRGETRWRAARWGGSVKKKD